jgi:long-chain acyl-CoA synthetase
MLYELLASAGSSHPRHPAIVQAGLTLTYGDLLAAVDALMFRFSAWGFGRGDRVAVQIPNSVEYVMAVFALGGLGVTIVPFDPALKPQETAGYARRARAGAALCRAGDERGSGGDDVVTHGVPSVHELKARPPGKDGCLVRPDPAYQPGQDVFLLLSSGTTGPPKIVPRSVEQVGAMLEVFGSTVPYSEDDVVLGVLPFFHSFGLFNVLLASVASGATLHVEPFSPRKTATTVERAGITVLPATPFMFRMLAETEFRRTPCFDTVRLAVSAGSALPRAVALRFRERLGVGIAESYGTTETGPIALARPEEIVEEPGWVGRPYGGVTVEVLGLDGRQVDDGVQGRIAVKSPANTRGYEGDPEANARSFRQGFFVTGDLGYRGEGGDLYVLGREKRMISVAGKKVSPSEVEACLMLHPHVAEVVVVAAVAPGGDERVKALIVPAGDVRPVELQEFCAARLADFKVPREVVFVDNLSQGPMGKPSGQTPHQTGQEQQS